MLKTAILVSASILFFSATAIALGPSAGGEFEIVKSTIDGGGGTSVGGDFSLTGTIGQHDATAQPSGGGEFLLAGGFWAKVNNFIFKDGFETD